VPSLRDAIVVAGAIGLVAAVASGVAAQPLNKLPPARAPCNLLSGQPCHPSFCSLSHKGPCFPQYGAPFGENLQLTIISTDATDAAGNATAGGGKAGGDAGGGTEQKPLDSIGKMFAALRACWVPPPKQDALHGMEYTIRFAFNRDGNVMAPPLVTYATHSAPAQVRDAYRAAVKAALDRCTPLQFSDDMAEAIVGQPIAVRFVDDRTIGEAKSAQ